MTDVDPRAQTRFNEASLSGAGASGGTMALIVDLQSAANMSRDDAAAFFAHMGERLDGLRARGVPVTWVTMGTENRLHAPLPDGDPAAVRDPATLDAMGFYGAAPGMPNHDVFADFLNTHGPRRDEAVYSKFYKDAFMMPEDHTGDPALAERLRRDYNTVDVALPRPGDFSGPSLTDYLQSRGTGRVLVAGMTSTHCVTDTALGAHDNNIRAAICTDAVLSWSGAEDQVNPRTSRLVWRASFDDPQDSHETKIRARLDAIAADPRRGGTAASRQATVDAIDFTTLADAAGGQGPVAAIRHDAVPGRPASG